MRIEIKKFGDKLISRPAGREAYLAAKAYQLRDISSDETIEMDFDGILVLAPSWADEFITPIKKEYLKVIFINADNPTVKASLKIIQE